MLSDGEIHRARSRGELDIDPWDDRCVQPASYDVHLGDHFIFVGDAEVGSELHPVRRERTFIEPGEFLLATTIERVHCGDRIVARVEGKSSLGRRGLAVHITAGFIDPGFEGTITLELHNVSRTRIVLTAGMPIAQLSFARMKKRARRPYGHPDLGSHYQHQETVRGPAR